MHTAVGAVLHANNSYKESEGVKSSAECNAEQIILSAFLGSEVLWKYQIYAMCVSEREK